MNKYEPVIGLEIHVQLKTKSKMFCSCDNTGEDKPANTTVCPICLGHPGVLPVPNEVAMRWAVMAALALNCTIRRSIHFDRKSYFYPDLPKGFQISQYDAPVGQNGHLMITAGGTHAHIRIERVHIEEDTGKLLHEEDKSASYVDYNRAGTPLLEIVTRPDVPSPAAAKAFLQELRLTMRYLGISDADMEKGHLRCDANISLRPNPEFFQEKGENALIGYEPDRLYPKTEVKNLNSFKSVEHALEYEIKRQTKLWDEGKTPKAQSTRGWDEKRMVSVLQRVKEEQHDYRYFPEPDIPPITFDSEFIASVKQAMVELPFEKHERFGKQYWLGDYDASILVNDKKLADYYESVVSELRAWLVSLDSTEGSEDEAWERDGKKLTKAAANWIISRLLKLLNEHGKRISEVNITPENFAELMVLVYEHKLNNRTAVTVLEKMFLDGRDPSDIMEEEDLGQLSKTKELGTVVKEVIQSNERVVQEFRAGKEQALKYLIGQVMKRTKGRADPEAVQQFLTHALK
ncbi:MAG: Asp-tRNA(Asn)/Glu-tRNA(Gln) amidotransferase subunit GatB [Patescibacteria group bacterium]|nr:Asp-tRNA(Asn)/Glu-tRNA(Gln) amidotransferase subunit GatB [Patescibacteria group bacterium]MDD5716087.1 Asp-tRNA(Asn)/Glu-tRNA(Gln) amidotransferase subunit GatB [Patescibacteria group bacterium]